MLATPWLEITNPQRLIIIEVQAAALAVTPVTDNTWNNFLMLSWEHYKAYQSYIDQITPYPTPWVDISGTSVIVGFASYTTKVIQYMLSGKLLTVNYDLRGTSNNAATSFTIPQVSKAASGFTVGFGRAMNGGGPATVGYSEIPSSSSVVTLYPGITAGAWGGAAAKEITGTIIIALT